MQVKTFGFKAAGDGLSERQFAGYANTWDLDSDGDMVMPGAFNATIPQFLTDGFIAWQHGWDNPIGKPIAASEDGTGLFIKAQLSDTTQGRDAITLVRDGVVRKMSIGFEVEQSEDLSDNAGEAMMGKDAYSAAKDALPRPCEQPPIITIW